MYVWDKRGEKGRGEEEKEEKELYVLGSINQSINHTYIRTYIPGM